MRSSIIGSSRKNWTRTIPNPERRALDKEIRAARADLAMLEREYVAAAADNSEGSEQRRPTMRGFKIAHGKLGNQLRAARANVAWLFERRSDVLKRIEVRDLSERAVVKLATERKHLTDIIKMIAYQGESDLLALLRPHYARAAQEARTLLHELLTSAGDIHMSDSELQITFGAAQLAASNARRPSVGREARPDVDDLPRLSFAASLWSASTTAYRASFPRSPGERSTATAVAAAT